MKQFLFLFALSVFSIIDISGQTKRANASHGWYQVNSEEGGFSVKFPSKTVVKSRDVSGLNINSYSLGEGTNIYFDVSYFELPVPNQEVMAREIEFFGNNYISKRKVQSLSSKKIQQGSCEGTEYTGFVSPIRTMHMRLFSSGQRIYQVSFETSSNSKLASDEGKYFLDSFNILDGCTGRFTAEIPNSETRTNFINGIADIHSGWRRIISSREKFEVLMPSGATVEEQQASVNPFPISKRFYTSEHQTGTYLIEILGDFPGGTYNSKNFEDLLDIMHKNLEEEITQAGAKMTFVRKLSFGIYPGREYNIISNNRIGRAQILITPTRSYIFMFSALKSEYLIENSDKFFNSIRVPTKN
ncbi:MAG: hypothetical protein ACR2N3_10485 [Pyrinomonadaceae bacterium]